MTNYEFTETTSSFSNEQPEAFTKAYIKLIPTQAGLQADNGNLKAERSEINPHNMEKMGNIRQHTYACDEKLYEK